LTFPFLAYLIFWVNLCSGELTSQDVAIIGFLYMGLTFPFLAYLIFWVNLCSGELTSQDVAIVGGEVAKPHEFPYLVDIRLLSLIWMRTVHACSGIIIHPRWILTAAHCITNRLNVHIVIAGKNDNSPWLHPNTERMVKVARIFAPETFQRWRLKDDIALLRLAKPLEFSEFIKAVHLPKPGFVAKGMATVAGWGTYEPERTSSNFLMKISLPIVAKNECREMYHPTVLYNTSLCAGYVEGGKDACDGNSGGGLFCNESDDPEVTNKTVLCGILSWGKGCALPKTPIIFTEVTCFLQWINDTITKHS